ncbi:MAG: sugar ABC transporter substrate-binding protein [Lachnospiraceae bacterium]|nr:sugar ABC transporter substrate-binding protein [Lachnospiraceae bacterium]
MVKKLLCIFLTALMTASLLAGCGGASDKSKKTYTFATWAAGTELAEFQEIINKVNEEANGEYTIEVLSIPSDYYVKISTKIAARKSPDFFWLTQELISKYAQMGALADITGQFEASQTLTPDMYYEGVLASASYNGSYWGLPWIANPMMVYYNKTMFEELGIPCPTATDDWTWEEFLDVCRQFSGKEYKGNTVYGTVFDGWPNIETFIWAGGGDIIAEDGSTIVLDSEEAKKGLGYLNTVVAEGLSPRYAEVASLGSNNVWFEKQRVAMYFGGIQDNFEKKVADMGADEQFEIGYAPLPMCDDGGAWSFDWTASTVMAKSLEGDETAYKALEAVTQAFFEWKVAPPVKDSLDNVTQIDAGKANAMETIAYTMDYARSANYIPEWSDINDKLWYNLYVQMLSDASFDYKAEVDAIAAYAREQIAKRK